MLVVSWFVCGIISFMAYNYLFYIFTCDEKFKMNYKVLLGSVLMGVIYYVINEFNLVYIRPYLLHIYIVICLMLLYNQKIIKTIIVVLFIFIILSICELLFGFSEIFIFKINIQESVASWYGYLLSNILIYLITLVVSMIPFVRKIISNITDWYNKNEFKTTIIFVILCMIVFTFFLYNNLIEALPKQLLWLTNMFCVAVIFFVINYFKEKANNNRIVTEYDQLLDYVQKYEKLIESKSKNQHEYKNQLVLIKNMISKTNKKAIEYIDNLYNEESDDEDVELLKKLQYLPNGGLKGLIYYKLEEMKDKKINFFVDISPKVKNVKINKKLDKNLKDISKVIGVYLDNAIEASLNSKEKYIVLEIYVEDNEWVFSISNTYNGKVSINIIDTEKFSTKGEGRGYGLSLAKDIINRSKILRQERELKGIYYTQRLYMQK